jgi:O-antigen/teichoic acid export membrane protein
MTGAAASLGKIVSLGTSILTVRLTFRYLGAERYGMWMTISSVVMMLGFADLGMSNGLVNMVANAMGREDRQAAKGTIASAFWMLSTIAAVVSLGSIAAYPFINTSKLFNVHSPTAVREAGPALLVFFLCFVITLPLGTVRGTQTGMQNGFINNLWNILGSIASLVALLIAIHSDAGLPVLVLSLAGPPLVASLLNGVELFGFSHPELLPSPSAFSRKSASRLFHTGMMFFLLQLSFSVGMQTDNVVIAQILGAKSVADYAVPARLFNVIPGFLVMVSASMWPAYADALARSDGQWIRRSFMRVAIGGTAITILATTILILFGNRILAVWVGPQIHASAALLTVFGLQCVLYAYLQPVSFLLNGIGKFRIQVITGLAMAALNLALSILFVRRYGVIGAVLGTVTSLVLVVVVPLTIVTMRTLNKLGRHPAGPGSVSVSG